MSFDILQIDYDDQKTWDLICGGRTKGVFQLESNLGRSWAKKTKPKNMEELSDLIAIIRPGCLKAMVSGKSMTQHYVDRKHNVSEIVYLHEALEPILKKTQGVLVYQEQSMQIAQKIADFDLQEADDLRKAIGKKKADLMAKVKKSFLEGAANKAIVTKDEAEEIFSWIEKSSRYAFNKSHSISYAICAYWSAYCKAHYPIEFYCKYIQHSGGKPDPQQEVRELVADARSNDIFINPPSLKALNLTTKIINGSIQIGNKQIAKLKEELPEAEKTTKKKIGDWSWFEFLVIFSSKIYATLVTALVSVGALGEKGCPRTKMLYEFDTWQKLTDKEREWAAVKYREHESLIDLLKFPFLPFRISLHVANATCKDILNGKNGNVKIAVTVNGVRKYITKKGDEMAFLSVEDGTGALDNIAIFKEQWQEYKNILYEKNNVLITGKKEVGKKDGIVIQRVLEI